MSQDILDQIQEMQRYGKRIGLVNGCFDLLHPGHAFFLEQAAQWCDHLVVGLNDDESVTALKGSDRPFWDYKMREYMLGLLESVGSILEFDGDVPALIAAVEPDVIIRGPGQHAGEMEEERDLIWIKASLSWSTSRTIRRIRDSVTWEVQGDMPALRLPESPSQAQAEAAGETAGQDDSRALRPPERARGALYVKSIADRHIYRLKDQWAVGRLTANKDGSARFEPDMYCATKNGLMAVLIDRCRLHYRAWLMKELDDFPDQCPTE